MRESRESGALGPWHSHMSQSSMPFRPSYAPSGMTGMSHSSWIDPFDFERPELRDQDAMSQLRQSIYPSSDDGRIVFPHQPSRRSEMSFTETDLSSLRGLPEEPQEMHVAENWPLRS